MVSANNTDEAIELVRKTTKINSMNSELYSRITCISDFHIHKKSFVGWLLLAIKLALLRFVEGKRKESYTYMHTLS